MDITCQHIAANCNAMPNTLQFLSPTTIAYCFKNQVGLYQLDQNKVTLNLNFPNTHINRANCLKCLPNNTIMVGYDSGHLIIFNQSNDTIWKIVQVTKQNTSIISIHHNQNVVITNNIAAEIIFYSINNQQLGKQFTGFLLQVDSIKFPFNKIIESIVSVSYKNQSIIFMGGADQKIHCYTRQNNAGKLIYRFQLTGHQNGITKIVMTQYDEGYLLASSSKDGYIRLWRITQNQQITKFHKNVKHFGTIYCFLDAVLISHQCSVTGLKWVNFNTQLQLVSCSLDSTICIWGYQKQGSAWTVDSRMGQFIGNKNAYFNITTDPCYKYLVAVNYIGSTLIWQHSKQTKKFTLRPSFNGHSNQVKDIDWNHTGDFLVSVSKDQTTRIICKNTTTNTYHQISRAQIHGYDLTAVSTLKINTGLIDLIACGADEKVIRIIEPPACFANYLNTLTLSNLHLYFPSPEQQNKYIISKPTDKILQYEMYSEGGIQVLGLMTKAQRVQRQKITSYYDDEQQQHQQQQQKIQQRSETKINYTIPPHDDYLVKHTLWPQMNKLYGHPHQISVLARCNSRKLLASSCFGKNKISCQIIIWNFQTWKIVKIIQFHQYTVHGIQFSPCGKYFASVSKDRKLAVFNQNFQLLFSYQAHTRAILCLAFSHDSTFLATGSRDKSIKLHSIQTKSSTTHLQIKKQVNSISYCMANILAIGCNDGTIQFLKLQNNILSKIAQVPNLYSHTMPITKLKYQNGLLASSSDDHSVRIFKINQK